MKYIVAICAGLLAILSNVHGKVTCPTIASFKRQLIPISSTSSLDSLTKGKSSVLINSGSFTSGAELNSTNNNAVQGVSAQQMGVNASNFTLNSSLFTGSNLGTVGKLLTGPNGGALQQMQTGAMLSNNTSTTGNALTKISGKGGALGNSTIVQGGTTIGANLMLGQVNGPVSMINLLGNPNSTNS